MDRHGGVFAWVIDDTGQRKKGTHSVGVARQYCGNVGKEDNCQVSVSVGLTNETISVPVAWRLYLPKEWTEDATWRRKVGVPPRGPVPDEGRTRAGGDRCPPSGGRPRGARDRGRRIRGLDRVLTSIDRISDRYSDPETPSTDKILTAWAINPASIRRAPPSWRTGLLPPTFPGSPAYRRKRSGSTRSRGPLTISATTTQVGLSSSTTPWSSRRSLPVSVAGAVSAPQGGDRGTGPRPHQRTVLWRHLSHRHRGKEPGPPAAPTGERRGGGEPLRSDALEALRLPGPAARGQDDAEPSGGTPAGEDCPGAAHVDRGRVGKATVEEVRGVGWHLSGGTSKSTQEIRTILDTVKVPEAPSSFVQPTRGGVIYAVKARVTLWKGEREVTVCTSAARAMEDRSERDHALSNIGTALDTLGEEEDVDRGEAACGGRGGSRRVDGVRSGVSLSGRGGQEWCGRTGTARSERRRGRTGSTHCSARQWDKLATEAVGW